MKRQCIFLASVALSLGVLAPVAAAESEENTQKHSRLEHLDLTDEQKEQLQALREQHREALRALRDTMAALSDQHREAQNAHREEFREAVMNILTEEQQATLDPAALDRELNVIKHGERIKGFWESMGNFRTALGRWWDDMNDPERTERLYSKLGLTDEQKETLRELSEAQREGRHRVRQRLQKAMDAILTDEQREKLKKLKDETF